MNIYVPRLQGYNFWPTVKENNFISSLVSSIYLLASLVRSSKRRLCLIRLKTPSCLEIGPRIDLLEWSGVMLNAKRLLKS